MPSSLLLTLPEGPWTPPPGYSGWRAHWPIAWPRCLLSCPCGILLLSLGTEDQRRRRQFSKYLQGPGPVWRWVWGSGRAFLAQGPRDCGQTGAKGVMVAFLSWGWVWQCPCSAGLATWSPRLSNLGNLSEPQFRSL